MLGLRVSAGVVSKDYGVTISKDFFFCIYICKLFFKHKMENKSDCEQAKPAALACSLTDASEVSCLLPRDYPLAPCDYRLPLLSTNT